jgi:hypothetical protein
MKRRDGIDMRALMSNPVFWQATTLAVPVASAAATMLFAFVVRLADAGYPSIDPSEHLVFAVVIGVMAIAAVVTAIQRTPRTLGIAAGTATSALLVAFIWLAIA